MSEARPTVSVEVPEPVYRRLKQIAEITHRSVEDVLIATVNSALPLEPGWPVEVADELAAMNMFNDDALWAAVESSLSPAQTERMRQLNETVDTRPLTDAEEAELTELMRAYDRAVLRRARALALLSQRGYDISAQVSLMHTSDDDR